MGRVRPAGAGAGEAGPQRDGVLVLMAAAVASVLVVSLAVSWLARQLVPFALLLSLAAMAGAVTSRFRVLARRREFVARTAQLRHGGRFLAMSQEEFAQALAELCRRDGCASAELTGPAELLVTAPDGGRLLLRTVRQESRSPLGPAELGQLPETHHDHRTALVTAGRFTEAATARCTGAGIRTVDQRALSLWADGSGPPPWA
ncbi:restriction endonuclease [Kitasatospora sp. NPDC051853]|uniref:restriction endonuclease n=1 Tax=Kitasatospora sp. NPDC051853 TaxID=3364058 RepID=UPI0037A697A9